MSRTFGGAAGDDISQVRNVTHGSTNSCVLMAGWWRPTTRTADRGFCGAGTIFGPAYDAVVDEIQLYADATTDGHWLTTAADLADNTWYFLAFLFTCLNTGSAESWRVWQGVGAMPPIAKSITEAQVSAGNFVGNATLTIGNAGTSALAFQGQIGPWLCVAQSAPGILGALPIEAAGTITDYEAQLVYDRWVFPFWNGTPSMVYATPPTSAGVLDITYWDGTEGVLQQYSIGSTIRQPLIVPTINGTSISAEAPPRSPDPRWMFGTS
jgi:hypothetical protein